MNDEEKKLRIQQEQAQATFARKALNEGKGAEALSFLQETTAFWPQNLITIMSVLGFHYGNLTLRKKASFLFRKHLKLCTNVKSLEASVRWLNNPIRSRTIGLGGLGLAIDCHRKSLEPSWNGIWDNPALAGGQEALATFVGKHPDEVTDPEVCLIAASQVGNWSPWVKRYRALNGNPNNPKFLKLWASKTVLKIENPSICEMRRLRKFTELGDIHEVRSFLRNITRTQRSAEGRMTNRVFAQYALYLYCECERLEHVIDDWVHIAESALYLNHYMVERIAQRVLANLERNSSADVVFDRLVRKHGKIEVTQFALRDIGPRGNPIWQNIYRLIPVNSDARRILAVYSRLELDSYR